MRPHKDEGFSLLEVLVALAIAALALGALFQTTSIVASSLTKAREKLSSALVAQSVFAGLGTEHPVVPGIVRGRTEVGIAWRLEIAPVPADRAQDGTESGWIELLQVEVEAVKGRNEPVRLSTLRIRPAEPKP